MVDAINENKYDFIVVNFANGDMVGHTGIYEAIEKAVVAVDACVKDVIEALRHRITKLSSSPTTVMLTVP